MRKVIGLVLMMLLSGCGETIYRDVVPETIEGIYQFKEVSSGALSGSLALTEDYQGKIDVEELETFRSQNFNGSYATHPRVGFSNSTILNDSMVYAGDINYSSSNDLEEDGTTSDLGSGRRYTVYNLFFDENNKLTLVIQIHDNASNASGGINDLVIERVFKSL